MDRDAFFDKIRELIAGGDTRDALLSLRDYLSGQETTFGQNSTSKRDEVLLQLARISRVTAEDRVGTITSADFAAQMQRIAAAALALTASIQNRPSHGFGHSRGGVAPALNLASVPTEKILSRNSQIKNINWLHAGLEAARSVCRVVCAEWYGTGFLVEGGYLMTNHHVLPDKSTAAGAQIELDFEETLSGVRTPVSRYRLNPSIFNTSAELDCTLVRVSELSQAPPISNWGALKLDPVASIFAGDNVFIIQHPSGGVKQICLTDNKVINVFDNFVQYTTDTLNGSSGSPVFNGDWRVVAIHHAGGDLLKNNRGERIFANQGILMKSIKTLRPDMFPT